MGRSMVVNSAVANALAADTRLTSRDFAGQQQGEDGYRSWRGTNGFSLIQEYPDMPTGNGTAVTGGAITASTDVYAKTAHGLVTGQRVVLRANAYPGRSFKGTIAGKPIAFFGESIPAAFSARRSGDVPVYVDSKGRDIPTERTYEAVVVVDNHEGLLRPGMTSRGKIYAGTHLWGSLLLQDLLRLPQGLCQ
jgi:hypothetical protein